MSSGPGPWRRIALVFPGQGAQHPGMGKALLDQFPYTRFVFEEVEEASQLSLRRIMFEGDEVGRRPQRPWHGLTPGRAWPRLRAEHPAQHRYHATRPTLPLGGGAARAGGEKATAVPAAAWGDPPSHLR